jgi:serine/threonine-protein kinase
MQKGTEPFSRPARLGAYEIVHEIGRGGMAVLYEARHVLLGVRVALKRPLPSACGEDVVRARLLNEARCAARIRHPNVIRIHDYGIENDVPYLAMELLEGSSLAAVLASEGPLPLRRAADLFLGVLSGMYAVHGCGITHRDLKPQNLFVRRVQSAEDPVVIDFGVAKCGLAAEGAEVAAKLTASGAVVGSAAYMAPEQIRGQEVGPAADQYSLAVTLYECLTGKAPFSGASNYEIMHAALHVRPRAPSEHRPELPPEVDDIVLRGLRRDPEKRFPSVHAMGEALLAFASEAAAVGWRADVLRASATTGASEVSGITRTDVARSDLAVGATRRPRTGRLVIVATAVVGATLGASSARLWDPGVRGAAAGVAGPRATAPQPPLELAPIAVACEPRREATPSTVATPPPSMTAASARRLIPPRPARGTNGAPILE